MGAKQTTIIANKSENRVYVVLTDKKQGIRAAEVLPSEAKRFKTAKGPISVSAFPINKSKTCPPVAKKIISGKSWKIDMRYSDNIEITEDFDNHQTNCTFC